MKQLISKNSLIFSFLLLSGCATNPSVAPSQNDALNSVSNSNAKKAKSYWIQSHLDSFFKEDWDPAMKKDKKIQEKYGKSKEGKSFTLQEFVDKRVAYKKSHPVDESKSNVKKLESMPVIGN